MDLVTLALAKGYTQSMVAAMATGIDRFEMEGSVLKIYCSSGEVLEMSFSPFKDGATITAMTVRPADNHLVIELDGEHEFDAGELPTSPGKIYTHEQDVANEVWIIQHSLNNQYPVVICLDEDDNQIVGEINYATVNQLSISFDVPLKGKVIIKNGG